MLHPIELDDGVVLRLVARGDGLALALAEAYARNRDHLAPWEPERSPEFFTAEVQEIEVRASLRRHDEGASVPMVLTVPDAESERIVGRVNLSDIVRGVFLSAHLGYWIDGELQGRGLATAAVGAAVHHAGQMGLHRVQAGTLVHNTASQTVLERNGFERFGLAPRYLRIAGEWQDHVLFQRLLEA